MFVINNKTSGAKKSSSGSHKPASVGALPTPLLNKIYIELEVRRHEILFNINLHICARDLSSERSGLQLRRRNTIVGASPTERSNKIHTAIY